MSAPNPKSLREVIRYHGSLCVNPIFWTSSLLDLLGCRFQPVDDETTSSPTIDQVPKRPPMSDGESAKLSRCERAARSMATPGLIVGKRADMEFLLVYGAQGAFQICSPFPNFFFANRRVHRSECNVFAPDDRAGPVPQVLVGHFQYFFIQEARSRKLEPPRHPGRGVNMAGWNLSRKRLFKVTPDDCFRDPYILCLLLSLAQCQARRAPSPQQTTYLSRLIVTTNKKPHLHFFVYLYEAQVSSQILDALDNPTLAARRMAWPTVKFKKIPIRPFEDFQARLIAELLAQPSPGKP